MEGYLHYGCYTLASHGFVPIVRHVIVTTKEPRSICTYHTAGVFLCLLLSSCVFVPTDISCVFVPTILKKVCDPIQPTGTENAH